MKSGDKYSYTHLEIVDFILISPLIIPTPNTPQTAGRKHDTAQQQNQAHGAIHVENKNRIEESPKDGSGGVARVANLRRKPSGCFSMITSLHRIPFTV
jgi:hypothetical protein